MVVSTGSLDLPILLGSTRRDRQSVRVAQFVKNRMNASPGIVTELLDLLELDLPMMEERLHHRDDAPETVKRLGERIGRADGLVIVSPEYNQGYPGVLKNALDYFYPEYERKAFGIVTVSAGGLGGVHCLSQLRLVTLALGAIPIPEGFSVSRVHKSFDEAGNPLDPALIPRFDEFLGELVWFATALKRQRASS